MRTPLRRESSRARTERSNGPDLSFRPKRSASDGVVEEPVFLHHHRGGQTWAVKSGMNTCEKAPRLRERLFRGGTRARRPFVLNSCTEPISAVGFDRRW